MVLIMPITAPEDGLIYSSSNVKLKINEKIIGTGILYISQGSLSWQGDGMADGISIEWKQISVHGVTTSPVKCIYFMLDHKLQWRNVYDGQPAAANGNGAGGDGPAAMDQEVDNEEDEGNASEEEDDEEAMTECWLMPNDVNTVDTIFQAMKDCQALHPDPADSVSEESDFMDDDDEDDGENGGDENGAAGGVDNGAEDAMNNLHINDDKFADAD